MTADSPATCAIAGGHRPPLQCLSATFCAKLLLCEEANAVCSTRAMIQPITLKEGIDAAGILFSESLGLCRSTHPTGAATANSPAGRLCRESGATWAGSLQGPVRVLSWRNAGRPARPAVDRGRLHQ